MRQATFIDPRDLHVEDSKSVFQSNLNYVDNIFVTFRRGEENCT